MKKDSNTSSKIVQKNKWYVNATSGIGYENIYDLLVGRILNIAKKVLNLCSIYIYTKFQIMHNI